MKPKVLLKTEYLKRLQDERGISDAALAEMASLNPTQIWRVKQGKCYPGSEFIAGILSAFPDRTFDDLFFLAKPLQVRRARQVHQTHRASKDSITAANT
jgi:transcriptional regulator with XRE-family HTH domain